MDYRKNRFWVIAGMFCAAMFVLASCGQGVDPTPTPAPVPVITINTQPEETTTVTQDSISGSLSVGATVTESAALTYQWYVNESASNTGGTIAPNGTNASLIIPTDLTEGTYYYYCEVKAAGADTKRSNVATVKVNPIGTPPVPVITINTQPTETTTVMQGDISESLSVEASVTESAALTYQWYSNTENSNTGGTIAPNGTNASLIIPTDLTEGTYYYYCEVKAAGADTKRSNVATVKVNPIGTPPPPVITITTQPEETTTVTQGDISGSLTIAASVTPDTALSYQWYSNTGASNTGGTAVPNATEANFTIPTTLTVGTYYYYCEVKATDAETKRSNAATVKVNATGTPVELIFNSWKDGNIAAPDGEQWFTFRATAATQYIHVRFGTLSALYVYLYDSNGDMVEGGMYLNSRGTYVSRAVNSGEIYYIKVTPYSNDSGTYEIGFTSTFVPPELSPTELTIDTWKDGNIAAPDGEQWFTFRATAATQYIHARFGTLDDLYVQLYDSNWDTVGDRTNLYGSTKYISRSVNSDEIYYIKVYSNDSGNYGIGFTATPVPPELSPTELTIDTWKNGNIAVPDGEQWFTFRATAATQYIHVNSGILDRGSSLSLNLRLYISAMNTVGTSGSFYLADYNGYTDYTSLSVSSGETYYIKVTPSSSYNTGNYSISILFNESSTLPPPVITINTQPEETTSLIQGEISGSSLHVEASATLDAPLSYQWYSNTSDSNSGGRAITDAVNSSYLIPSYTTLGTYYYYCEVSAPGGAGPVSSETATVIVDKRVDGEFVIQLGGYMDDPNLIEQSTYASSGTDRVFTIAGTEYTEYQWYINGESAGTAADHFVFNKGAGTYELAVVVSNAAGIKYSGRCYVTVR